MPLTHIPEICTENQYQKTSTINRHENSIVLFVARNGTRKIWYQTACQMLQKLVPFLALISGMYVIGISVHNVIMK